MLHFPNYRQDVDQLINAAITAVNPTLAVRRFLRRTQNTLYVDNSPYDLAQGRCFLISVGKAARPMAQAAINLLGDDLSAAIIISKRSQSPIPNFPISQSPISFFQAAHPVSDEVSVQAATAVSTLLATCQPNDLVLCLISGGTSALLAQPLLPLADWQALTAALLGSGCNINEFNTVRRQLDEVKGGGLARWAAPATCVSLILSDVVGNPLEFIGSGPTVAGTDTVEDVRVILTRYQIEERLAAPVWQHVQQALHNVQTAPRPQTPLGQNVIVGDLRQAAEAAFMTAGQLGFMPHLLTTHLEGEAREVGRFVAAIAKDAEPGYCFILGGETTVTMKGNGRGGRNQELALAAAIGLDGRSNSVIVSVATDGEDGPTDAAGAVVTGETAGNGRFHHLNPHTYLANNDSYSFFTQLDAKSQEPTHIKMGPTGTNVNDLIFILTYPQTFEVSKTSKI